MHDGRAMFGALVRAARERKGLSQKELADRIGVVPSMISKLEAGAKGPSIDGIIALASILDIDLNQLRRPEEQHTPEPAT